MIKQVQNIFIVGIGGIAMFNLAIILKKMGKNVSGSDAPTMTMTDVYLEQNNIPFEKNFNLENIPASTELVIYSGSHQGVNNPQVQESQKRGIKIIPLAVANGELCQEFGNVIAVCGCHGKTTTSSLMAQTLKGLGKRPSYLIGTGTFNENFGGDYDSNEYFVIEADEYGVNPPGDKTPKFMHVLATHIICTNIDFDHPDIYSDLEAVKEAYYSFFQKNIEANPQTQIFLCADDTASMEVAARLSRQQYKTFGYSSQSDLQIRDINATEMNSTFVAVYKGEEQQYTLSIFGEKNISNAAGVVLALLESDCSYVQIQKTLSSFTGAKRRFEEVTKINDVYLFDDYAHHPHEIVATLGAARQRFTKRRVIVLFQPHTYSRTAALKVEFVEALAKSDLAFLLPIYASAREKYEDSPIMSEDLVTYAHEHDIQNIISITKEDIFTQLESIVQKGDVIITMGAGDIYQMKDGIIKVLEKLI